MARAERNVDGLVFRDELCLIVNGHPCGALNYDPMLCPMVVALQAERRAWIYVDAFDLKPMAKRDAFEPTPRAMIFGKLGRLSRPVAFQGRHGQP